MIPEFDPNGNLPVGTHDATLAEIKARFAYNDRRRQLFEAMEKVVLIFRSAKCPEMFLDGSYITSKLEPGGYDFCWEPTGIIPTEDLRGLFREKAERKKIYLGDIFPRLPQPPYFPDHVIEWQTDRDDNPKGIIRIVESHDD